MAELVRANNIFHPREFFKLEASGVRTSLASVVPLVVGQITGYQAIGLFVGLSGLYLSVSDKEGATVYTLLLGLTLNASMIFAGTLIGNYLWASMVLLFVLAFASGMMRLFG